MKRILIGIALLASLISGYAPFAQAQAPLTFTGTINEDSGCMAIVTHSFPADIVTFTVPVNGDYTITYQSHTWTGDPWSYVMQAPYDPSVAAVAQTLLATIRTVLPSATITLTAGTTYYLATNNNQSKNSSERFIYAECLARVATDSGSYIITSDIPAPIPPTPIPTMTQWSLMLLALLLGMVGITRIRRQV